MSIMRQLDIIVYNIDCNTLVRRLAEGKKAQIRISLIMELLWRLYSPIGYGKVKQLAEFSKHYGVTLDTYLSKNRTKSINLSGVNYMLKITASINAIDIQKAISEFNKKTANNASDSLLINATLRIIQPFIGKTFATIPPSAIAELFMLFGRDKITELAGSYGIKLTDLSVTADNPKM